MPPQKVAQVVCTALCAPKPGRRYLIGCMVGSATLLEALAGAILKMRF